MSEQPADGQRASRRDRTMQVIVIVLIALLVVFSLVNLDEVDVNWALGTWRTPLIVVILLSGLLGVAVGWTVAWRRARRGGKRG